uniref:Predicted protein n=1 Tax=Hordeum vulgare subsp. vulgare TaxID=112509 RepID=F2D9K1_HORVV|nr:predicted protein [Hordeum vulgare subsp. vulgare]
MAAALDKAMSRLCLLRKSCAHHHVMERTARRWRALRCGAGQVWPPRLGSLLVRAAYILAVSWLGYLLLDDLKFRAPPAGDGGGRGRPRGIDLFFTAVSAMTVSSMSAVEMEVFSDGQLSVLIVLMFAGSEVFVSLVGLASKWSKLRKQGINISQRVETREPQRRGNRARNDAKAGRRHRRRQLDARKLRRDEQKPDRGEAVAARGGALAAPPRPRHHRGGARTRRHRHCGLRLRVAGREADAAEQGPGRVDLRRVHDGFHVLELRVNAEQREHGGVQEGHRAAAAARAAGAGGEHTVPDTAGRVRARCRRSDAAAGAGGDDRQKRQGADGVLSPSPGAAVRNAGGDSGRARRRAGGHGVRHGVGWRAAGYGPVGEGVQRGVRGGELPAHRRVDPRPLNPHAGHHRLLGAHDEYV